MEYMIVSHVAAIAVGSVLISGAAVVACAALGRVSASFRHLVLAGMFVSLLALPAMSLLMPAWNLPVMPAVELFRAETQQVGLAQRGSGDAFPSVENKTDGDPAMTPGHAREQFAALTTPVRDKTPLATSVGRALTTWHLPLIALVIWGIGALIVLVVQLVRWAGAGFIAEMAMTVENSKLLSITERIRWEMGIKRRVGLLRSDMAAVSMVWGIRQPYVILPSSADSWPADKVEAVLRHELAHVKRRDNLLQIVAVLACGLYWFNPLVWTAMRRFYFEREVACDNIVLNAGSTASAYAKHLMEISMSVSGPKSRRIVPALMAHSSDIKRRLLSVLTPGVSRSPVSISAVAICVGFMLVLTLPASTLRLGPRGTMASSFDAFETLVLTEQPGGGQKNVSMKLTGSLHVNLSDEYRYLRGGKLKMHGSYTATGKDVFIREAEIIDKKSNIRIKAKNVELDPDAALGCRFDGRKGYMYITRRDGGRDIEYRVRQRRRGGEDLIEATVTVDGTGTDFDEQLRREFKDIAVELYNILNIDDDVVEGDPGRAHKEVSARGDWVRTDDGHIRVLPDSDTTGRHTSSTITIRDGQISSDEGVIEVDGVIKMESWSFRGSMDGTPPRVIIVDGTLRNEDAYIEIEGRNLILDPDTEKGFRFNKDKGYIRVTRYADEAKIEFECRRKKKGRKLVTTTRFYLDGEEVEPDAKGERELKRILESAYHWLTDGNI
ncbi:MAG: M56 family metallopeptidase [Candidatus Latescibacterota bacterium]|nr:MAG: M56 family metallopeptidase [Candidatus Latescibacterota bacterium]